MPQAKKPARVIDLASARAARAEAGGDPVVLKWSDKLTFDLPSELPADFALKGQEGDIRGAIEALLGTQAETFFGLSPSMNDIEALMEAAAPIYGISPGESPASGTS